MTFYHKIQSLYQRNDRGDFMPYYSCPEFEYLRDLQWDWSEKIDGTNIRIELSKEYDDDIEVGEPLVRRIGGRKENSQIPAKLIARLDEIFPLKSLLRSFPDSEVTLYGEGIGPGIQKGGGNLRAYPDFVLFDVKVGDWWLRRENVAEIAKTFAVQMAPHIGMGTLDEAEERVKHGFESKCAQKPGTMAEGLVLRPMVDLFARNGDRVITKIKTRDYPNQDDYPYVNF